MLRFNNEEDVKRVVCVDGCILQSSSDEFFKEACAVTLLSMAGGDTLATATAGINENETFKDVNGKLIRDNEGDIIARTMAGHGVRCLQRKKGTALEAMHRLLRNCLRSKGERIGGGCVLSVVAIRRSQFWSKLLGHAGVTPAMSFSKIRDNHTDSLSRVFKDVEDSIRKGLGLKQMSSSTDVQGMIVCQLARLVEICQFKGTRESCLKEWEKSFGALISDQSGCQTKASAEFRETWMKRLRGYITNVSSFKPQSSAAKTSADKLIRFVCDDRLLFPNKESPTPTSPSNDPGQELVKQTNLEGRATETDMAKEYAKRRMSAFGLANPTEKSKSVQGSLLRILMNEFKAEFNANVIFRNSRAKYRQTVMDCDVWRPVLQQAELRSPTSDVVYPMIVIEELYRADNLLRDEWNLRKMERGGPLKEERNFALCQLARLWELVQRFVSECEITNHGIRLLQDWRDGVDQTLFPPKGVDTSLRQVLDLIRQMRRSKNESISKAQFDIVGQLYEEVDTIIEKLTQDIRGTTEGPSKGPQEQQGNAMVKKFREGAIQTPTKRPQEPQGNAIMKKFSQDTRGNTEGPTKRPQEQQESRSAPFKTIRIDYY